MEEILYDPIINRGEKIEKIKKIIYDLRNNLFKPEHHYNPARIGNAFSSNYTEYKNNADKDKTLSIKDYFDKMKPYLRDIINDHKTHGEWKIQMTM